MQTPQQRVPVPNVPTSPKQKGESKVKEQPAQTEEIQGKTNESKDVSKAQNQTSSDPNAQESVSETQTDAMPHPASPADIPPSTQVDEPHVQNLDPQLQLGVNTNVKDQGAGDKKDEGNSPSNESTSESTTGGSLQTVHSTMTYVQAAGMGPIVQTPNTTGQVDSKGFTNVPPKKKKTKSQA